MSFGQNLIALREARKISRVELAMLLEIPYTTLRNYETDQREPGHKLLIKIAITFDVSVVSLFGNTKKSPAPAEPEAGNRFQELSEIFKQITEEGQEDILKYSRYVATKPEYKKYTEAEDSLGA